MKKILCYGDSNTFGFNPIDGSRYDENTRWTSLLQKKAGSEYLIIEEGANNRTGAANNKSGFLYSAKRHFPKLLSEIKDIDILILAIGTNDLQFQYDLSLNRIEKGIEELIIEAKSKVKDIILIPPVKLDENILNGFFKIMFDETSISKSRKIGKLYKKLARIYDITFFDINEFVIPSSTDGLHYDIEAHKIIAEKLFELIKE